MAVKHKGYLINNFDPAQTYLKQQLEKNFKIIFASPFKKEGRRARRKKRGRNRTPITKRFALHVNAISYNQLN